MKPVIVDVREPFEYKTGHVKGALNIPPSELLTGAKQLAGVDKDTPIVLYCRTGTRSNAAIHILRSLGYSNLTNGRTRQRVEATYGL